MDQSLSVYNVSGSRLSIFVSKYTTLSYVPKGVTLSLTSQEVGSVTTVLQILRWKDTRRQIRTDCAVSTSFYTVDLIKLNLNRIQN